jgi:hypothetical protein
MHVKVQIANPPDVNRYLHHNILDLRAILALRHIKTKRLRENGRRDTFSKKRERDGVLWAPAVV